MCGEIVWSGGGRVGEVVEVGRFNGSWALALYWGDTGWNVDRGIKGIIIRITITPTPATTSINKVVVVIVGGGRIDHVSRCSSWVEIVVGNLPWNYSWTPEGGCRSQTVG